MNQPTLLEKYSLSDEDFDGLRNMLHILKSLQKRVRLKPENVDLLVFLRGNKDFVDWD